MTKNPYFWCFAIYIGWNSLSTVSGSIWDKGIQSVNKYCLANCLGLMLRYAVASLANIRNSVLLDIGMIPVSCCISYFLPAWSFEAFGKLLALVGRGRSNLQGRFTRSRRAV